MAAWRGDMAGLAAHANVTCKLSGLLTELMPGGRVDDVKDAAGILFDLFGPERLLWGSDWPVLGLAGTYRDWFELARDAAAARQSSAVHAVIGANAGRIYRPSRHIRA
jgi:L-fuconolactonase